jgi:hypothetical protein
MRITLILTSAIKPSHKTPYLRHFDEKLRLKETLICLKKWQRIVEKNNFRCILVDNTLNQKELRSKFSAVKFPNLRLIAAPSITDNDLKRGAGYCELKSLKYAISRLDLSNESLIIKCNARYFIRNFENLFRFVNQINKIYFMTYLRIDRAETKFFIITLKHLREFLEYAEIRVNLKFNLEHSFAKYIYLNAYHESISLPIEPVIFGVSGHSGRRYKFFTEAWAKNKINVLYRNFR